MLPAVCVHESSYTHFKYDPDPLPGVYTPIQSVLEGLPTLLHEAVTDAPAPTLVGLADKVGAFTVICCDVANNVKPFAAYSRNSYVPGVIGIVIRHEPEASAVLPAVCVHESSYTQLKYDPDPVPGVYTPTQSVLEGLPTLLHEAVTAPPVPTAEGVPDNVGIAACALPLDPNRTATSPKLTQKRLTALS